MIPKIIHYCWFGKGKKSILAKKCIESWKKYCPEYEIIEWNEDNFDINYNAYTKMCYKQKKYAFLTDYLRLLLIEKYGGIYFDTDVEIVRGFDTLLNDGAFFGFETDMYVNTGEGFGAEQHHPIVIQMLHEYDRFLDGMHGTMGCPHLNTDALLKFGLIQNGKMQKIVDATIYPAEYFNPLNSVTGELTRTSNTYSIHWYSASWMPWYIRLKVKIGKPVHRIIALIKR